MPNNLYNQYIYKNGSWYKIGTSSESVTYTITYADNVLTLYGSDGSESEVTITSGSGSNLKNIAVNGTIISVDAQGTANITVPIAATTTPLMDGTGAIGSSTKYAKEDHVHPSDTSKADTATTLSGYGITDASISNRTITLGSNTITVPEDMVILSYGSSTWNDFINAYNTNRVVYCRASSNSNPATGSQTRLAFMAYVNNEESPTNVEFQYYRSVNSHSDSQQGDQVYVYKLESANGGKWTVTVRESYTKIVAGTNMTSSYSSGVLTLNATQPDISGKADIASTLAGYGIEDAYISNGTITLGSDTITPLTSFTESDPIFVASAAYGISSSDITTWNGKQSPATTLSGYGITDAKIESGTITLGSNSITPLTSFTETDPTVPSWAKQSTKPTYTASEVGAIASSLKGASNGVAELDANGLVPTSQLPSYVDDVLEYATKSSFPATGETGKIYVDISTNLTYRWSGSAYVEISPSLALGTTSSTAFRGDYGQSAYTHAVTNKGSAFTSGLYKITTNSEGHVTNAVAVTSSDIPGLSSKADSATTLAGYGITDATIQNGTITLGSNSITPLTSYTETDPIFTASAAYGISSTDITNWNSKTSNQGTITRVKTTAGAHVTINVSAGDAEFNIPTNTSHLTNDSGYITSAQAPVQSVNGQTGAVVIDDTGTFIVPVTVTWDDQTQQYINPTTTVDVEDIIAAAKDGSTIVAEIHESSTPNYKWQLRLDNYEENTDNSRYDVHFVSALVSGQNNIISSVNGNFLSMVKRQGNTIIHYEWGEGSIPSATSDLTNDSGFIASDEIGKVYVSDTEPSNTSNYDIWIDTSTTLQNANGVMV